MKVEVVVRQRAPTVSASSLATFTRRIAARAPRSSGTGVTILLTGDGTQRRLNRTFRGKDKTTDVLSFPAGDEPLPDGSRPLGDIVISVAQAARQAARAGHSLSREIRILVIHGYLHLLGYDHEVDDGTMVRLQARLMRTLLKQARR